MRLQQNFLSSKPLQDWQVYRPINQDAPLLSVFNRQIRNLFYLILVSCFLYLIVTLISPLTIVVCCVLIITCVKLTMLKIKQFKKEGIYNLLNEKWRKNLYQKSIYDIYSDILYFPIVTKIIGAFIRPLVSKPHPDILPETFRDLPQKVQETISKKGLFNLAPLKLQNLVLDKSINYKLPLNYGESEWDWYNYEKYQNHHQKVHEKNLVKGIIQKIDSKVSWSSFFIFAGIVITGIISIRPNSMRKMLIQNGSFAGLIFVTLITLVKLKKLKDKRQILQIERVNIQMILDKEE